jgi:hypothetical protein
MNIQLETFNSLLSSLKGPTKMVAKRILNRDFVEALNKIPDDPGKEDINNALKSLLETAARKVTNAVARRIAVVCTVIVGIIAIISIIVTSATGGNVIIPIVIFAVIIVIIWIITGKTSKNVAHKVSDKMFKVIESKIVK